MRIKQLEWEEDSCGDFVAGGFWGMFQVVHAESGEGFTASLNDYNNYEGYEEEDFPTAEEGKAYCQSLLEKQVKAALGFVDWAGKKTSYTKEPWRVGNYHSCVVSDTPIDGVDSESSVEYYGGHCICESCTDDNADRIVACVNACAGIRTEALESGLIKHLLNDAYMRTLNPFDPNPQRKQDMTYLGKPVYEEDFEEVENGKE